MQSSARSRAQSRRGVLLIGASAVLWGTVGIASKALMSLDPTNALSIGFYRLAFSAPILLAVGWRLFGRGMFRFARRDFAPPLLLGAVVVLYRTAADHPAAEEAVRS